MEVGEVHVRNAAVELVTIEAESEEAGEVVDGGRNLAGEAVVGEVKAVETGEGGERDGEVTGEVVVGEEEESHAGEVGEVWYGAVEAVVFEAEDTELSEGG